MVEFLIAVRPLETLYVYVFIIIYVKEVGEVKVMVIKNYVRKSERI